MASDAPVGVDEYLTSGKTGVAERAARDAGYRPQVSYVHPGSHAHYYPGAEPVHVKLVSDAVDGRLLGAQVIGEDGVDKRIDVFATALYNAMPVQELFQLDLAYAYLENQGGAAPLVKIFKAVVGVDSGLAVNGLRMAFGRDKRFNRKGDVVSLV